MEAATGQGPANATPAQPSPSSQAETSQKKAAEQWESGSDLWEQPPEQRSSESGSTGTCVELSRSGAAVQPDSGYPAFGVFLFHCLLFFRALGDGVGGRKH